MTLRSALVVWAALLLLLGAELVFVRLPALRQITPFIGLAMALLVALTFMRLGSSHGLPPIFALVALFWLCLMLGLGTMDPFTRHDIAAAQSGPQ